LVRTPIALVKAHAYGNDFLLMRAADLPAGADLAALARRACDRHRGVGADGLLIISQKDEGQKDEGQKDEGQRADRPLRASMRLLNADGSRSEVSGNGVRCIGAWLAERQGLRAGETVVIETEAGPKTLTLLGVDQGRPVFRAAMGQPEDIREVTLDVGGVPVDVITLRVGNPQCVVLGPATPARLRDLAGSIAVHPHFPHGTNVELAAVESPTHVRILIWERGVGPTSSSGTGTCAAAVAAAAFGGASREMDVEAPGGTQRVVWTPDGLWLTGWATIVAKLDWYDTDLGN
jgi:diaminopimelate epimerase